MVSQVDLLSSTLASSLRGWSGISSQRAAAKPAQMLQLFDIENCPYCRLAREALTELDLDAEIYPCPKGGKRFRPALTKRGGKAQFPYLVDPNTGEEMYESLDIVRYLYEVYGRRALPLKWRLGEVQKLSSAVASGPRAMRGLHVRASRAPEEMLELFSFEASPYARPVRELLCELELPYVLRSCGRSRLDEWLPPPLRERLGIVPESQLENRRQLQQSMGKVSIPFLRDPNTEAELFESDAIVDYLEQQYAL